jgi:hypothetical protein
MCRSSPRGASMTASHSSGRTLLPTRRVSSAALAFATLISLLSAFTAAPSRAAAPDKAQMLVGGSPLSSITTSPPALSPTFSQLIHDYVVRCQAGVNTINFTFTAASGSIQVDGQSGPTVTVQRSLLENQPAVVNATDPSNPSGPPTQYWIRCLPHDFPLITASKPGIPSPGWYLTSNVSNPGPGLYAMVLDNNGTPVWYAPTPNAAIDVRLLPNNTLAWAPHSGQGVGEDPNAAYSLYQLDTQTTQLQPTPIRPMDFHELLPLSNGDRMMIASPLRTGVTLPPSLNSANGTAVDCILQEVSPLGNLVWSWDALNHIAPSENMIAALVPYNGQTVADLYHCNSIDVDPLASNPSTADVLVSLRNADAVIRINRSNTQIPDGKIIWKLGGSPSNQDGAQILQIQSDPETSIYGQHDARFQPGGDVTVYDDHTGQPGAARGLEYNINLTTSAATLVVQFLSPDGLNAAATGSFRRYDNGSDNVIGWGSKSGISMSEVDGSGNHLLDMTLNGTAYRFIKVPLNSISATLLRETAGVTGLLRVTSSPSLPTQILVDGQLADSWGLNWLKETPGVHTLCFTHVEGWTEPPCQTVIVNGGATTTVTGSFTQRGLLHVSTSPAVPSQITLDGNPTDDWGTFTDVPTGAHTVCYGKVANFDPPGCQNVTVNGGALTTTAGTFTSHPGALGQSGLGSLRVVTSPALQSQITIKPGVGSPHIADSWGLNWLELPPASYTVSFSHIEGWTEPAPQSVTVTADNTTTISGTFIQRGLLHVFTSPPVAGTVLLDGLPRDDWGLFTDVTTGSHGVCFGSASGFANTPTCQTVTVNAGLETDVSGSFS